MEQFESILEFLGDVLDIIEQFLLGIVAKTATWLSPMVPAIFIYTSVMSHFSALPVWSAYLVAYVIEALGLTTIMNTMDGWQQFQRERTKANSWVFAIAASTALFYVLLNICLVIVLKVFPALAMWATGLLSVLSVVAGVSTVMRLWQSRRIAEARNERRQTERERKETTARQRAQEDQEFALRMEQQRAEHQQRLELERLKLETKLSTANRKPVAKPVNQGEQPHEDKAVDSDKVDKALGIYRDKPRASLRFVGNQIGMTHTGVSKMLDRLESQKVIHRNGNGVEILA